jgi:CRISPR-associated Csx2 family protein
MTTLISFLGKNRRDPVHGYQRAIYEFPDGAQVKTAFFGAALVQRLKPDRTLLLGTAGSMWDALDFDPDAPEWAELVDATEQASVDQGLLDRVSLRAREAMPGAELVLIPYGRDEAAQLDLLANLAARVGQGEQVVLDITHGFRHLPLLALVAARYLSHVRQAVVTDIYYGALEMTANGVTPVLKLDGLLRMLDWVEALAAHDASGNYGVFAPLLVRDGLKPEAASRLESAAYLERVTNVSDARAIVTPLLDDIARLGGPTGLFKEQLAQRLAWARKPDRESRELALHLAYLARKDFLRAAIYLQESAISAACSRLKLDPGAHGQREEARESLKANPGFRSLSDIRNMLAHGTVGGDSGRSRSAVAATASAGALAAKLAELRVLLEAQRKG